MKKWNSSLLLRKPAQLKLLARIGVLVTPTVIPILK
jgi:hypothetical protein